MQPASIGAGLDVLGFGVADTPINEWAEEPDDDGCVEDGCDDGLGAGAEPTSCATNAFTSAGSTFTMLWPFGEVPKPSVGMVCPTMLSADRLIICSARFCGFNPGSM